MSIKEIVTIRKISFHFLPQHRHHLKTNREIRLISLLTLHTANKLGIVHFLGQLNDLQSSLILVRILQSIPNWHEHQRHRSWFGRWSGIFRGWLVHRYPNCGWWLPEMKKSQLIFFLLCPFANSREKLRWCLLIKIKFSLMNSFCWCHTYQKVLSDDDKEMSRWFSDFLIGILFVSFPFSQI